MSPVCESQFRSVDCGLSAFLSRRAVVASAGSLFVAAILVGCGGDAPPPVTRYEAAGKVTFEGQPVPSGTVTFVHKETKTLAACPIENGSYASKSGEGPAAGPSTINITGYDAPNGKPLWGGAWSTDVDVPKSKYEKDFTIAKTEVKKVDPKVQSTDPGDNQ